MVLYKYRKARKTKTKTKIKGDVENDKIRKRYKIR